MKERLGFVSNSSSSNFLVCTEDTMAWIMKDMVKHLIKERSNYSPSAGMNNIIKILKWLEENNYDGPMMFPYTCNYETWMFRVDENLVAIFTCNNDNFIDMDGDYYLRHMNDDEKEDLYKLKKSIKFLDLSDLTEKTYDEY